MQVGVFEVAGKEPTGRIIAVCSGAPHAEQLNLGWVRTHGLHRLAS